MNEILSIAFGAGLQDSLNPCIFITCAVFIIYGLWLKGTSLPTFWFPLLFVLFYLLNSINFNFGPGQVLTLNKEFVLIAKILYFILSVVSLALGVFFAKDWALINFKNVKATSIEEKLSRFTISPIGGILITFLLAAGLSALATLWPINTYFMLLGNEYLLREQWQTIMPLLMTYLVTSMWPFWILWSLLSVRNLQASLIRIIYALVFFTATSAGVLIFK